MSFDRRLPPADARASGALPLPRAVPRRRTVLGGLGLVGLSGFLPFAGLLGGCGKRGPDFDNLDITGSRDFDPRFSLPDAQGAVRTIADWHGKVVVLLFGYTQCPDVCPTALAELARAKARLGDDGTKLQVVFVSVDPERDTPPILTEYVHAFDPGFIALRPPTDAAVQQLAKQFHVYVEKTPAAAPASGASATVAAAPNGTNATNGDAGAYGIAHTAVSFVFDPQGRLRLYAKDGEGVDRWVHDVRLLLAPDTAAAA